MTDDANHIADDPTGHPPHYVKQWREFMDWTQDQLAEKAHVSQTKIARIESGERKLKTDFLRVLAHAFKVTSSALLDVNPSTKEGAQTARLLLEWNKLTTSQRDNVLRMVRGLTRPDDQSEAS